MKKIKTIEEAFDIVNDDYATLDEVRSALAWCLTHFQVLNQKVAKLEKLCLQLDRITPRRYC